MPWMRWGPSRPPDSTAEPRGSTATIRRWRLRSRKYPPAPVIVPPVPTPATSTSGAPSSARSISGPVVRRCTSGLAGFENWSGSHTSSVASQLLRRCHRLAHPPQRLGDPYLCPVQLQQALALAAHPLRQRQHQLVPLRRAHHRQRDPRVAAGRLHDRRAARLDPALLLRRLDHRHADPDPSRSHRGWPTRPSRTTAPRRSSIRSVFSPSSPGSSTSGVSPTSSAMLIGIRGICARQ